MKTIEEISEFFGDKHWGDGNDATMDRQILACREAVEFAQRWIPVSEELPNPYTFILCKCSLGDYYISCSNASGEIISSKGETITHWRPIEYK